MAVRSYFSVQRTASMDYRSIFPVTYHFCISVRYPSAVTASSMRYLVILLLVIGSSAAHAQFSIGTWRDHLPYGRTIDVCVDEKDLVWCATPYSVFTYNPPDGEIQRISKINLLSDVGISVMEFDPQTRYVLIGYENGNLDLIRDGKSINLPDIRLSSVVGDKQIYNIFVKDGRAYLCTGLGIVVIDLEKLEVRATYFIGETGEQLRVNDVVIAEELIYAATDLGVRVANANDPFLANAANWSWLEGTPPGSVSDIEFVLDHLFICVEGETEDVVWWKEPAEENWEEFTSDPGIKYNKLWSNDRWLTISGDGVYKTMHVDLIININVSLHNGNLVNASAAVVNRWGEVFVADKFNGLLVRRGDESQSNVRPQGPATADTRRISAYNNNVWIAHGGVNDGYGNFWNKFPISGFVDEQWRIIDPGNGANGSPGVNDLMNVVVDPIDNKRVIYGSWEEGLVEINPNGTLSFYNATTNNSTLLGSGVDWAPGWTGVAGVDYDLNGILWMTNSLSTRNLHARDRSGNFFAFNLAPVLDVTDKVGEVMASQLDYVWALVPGKGIVVLSTNGTLGSTSDDNFKLLTSDEGEGGLPSNDVLSIAEDLDSEVWVGTLQGLAVFYNQDAIFESEQFDAEPILITQDGNVQILLETEAITAIEIDGGNRKWVGTQNSGVFLFSPDGLQQIAHFTTRNSPLLSDNIFDIAINQENGEVFFATENGIVSYFATATNFDQGMENVRAFPNPVRPEYEGNITVDGLAYDSTVKITDVQGNIVFETQSQGGRAVWDGKLLNGERPATGIYYVFAATRDGSVDSVAKIAFIR
jgi:hypothetical protein